MSCIFNSSKHFSSRLEGERGEREGEGGRGRKGGRKEEREGEREWKGGREGKREGVRYIYIYI